MVRTSLAHETSQDARSFPDRLVASDADGPSARPPLVLELIRAPPQGGAEPLLLTELVELRADLGAGRVEPGQHVEAAPDRVAEAGRVGTAVDGELGGHEGLRRHERHAARELERRG